MSNIAEFINWSCTQTVIWLVAMRFYESIIPVKRLELNMRAQEAASHSGESAPVAKRFWLEKKSTRNKCTVIWISVSIFMTLCNVSLWLIC